MIMLIYYNELGKEMNCILVWMNYNGWLIVEFFSEGCEKIWMLLVVILLCVDGFKIYVDYYVEFEENEDNYWCCFSLSSGVYFDYFFVNGIVINLSD